MAAQRTGRTTSKPAATSSADTLKGKRLRVRVQFANGDERTLTIGGLRMVVEVERRFGAWRGSLEQMAWAVFTYLGKPNELELGEDEAFERFLDDVDAIDEVDAAGNVVPRPTKATPAP